MNQSELNRIYVEERGRAKEFARAEFGLDLHLNVGWSVDPADEVGVVHAYAFVAAEGAPIKDYLFDRFISDLSIQRTKSEPNPGADEVRRTFRDAVKAWASVARVAKQIKECATQKKHPEVFIAKGKAVTFVLRDPAPEDRSNTDPARIRSGINPAR